MAALVCPEAEYLENLQFSWTQLCNGRRHLPLCWSRRARAGTHQLGTRRAPIKPHPRSAQTRQGRTSRQATNLGLGQRKNERTPLGGREPRIACAPLPSSPRAGERRGFARSRPSRSCRIDDCRRRTLLVLLPPPVPGHAPRLVHRQRRGHEQEQQGTTGVGHGLSCHACHGVQ
jgi:hypothetical protein